MPDGHAEGHAALAALDRALAHQPVPDAASFTEATEHLCVLRDALIADRRAGGASDSALRQLNAVLSSTLSGHFPLGTVSWPLIRAARDSLRDLLAGLDDRRAS